MTRSEMTDAVEPQHSLVGKHHHSHSIHRSRSEGHGVFAQALYKPHSFDFKVASQFTVHVTKKWWVSQSSKCNNMKLVILHVFLPLTSRGGDG